MWSVPFNFNIHDSYFGVGMVFNRGRFSSSSYWFNQMYYSEKGPFKRGAAGQTITYENSAVVVVAHMESSTYHPMLNVSVIPQVRYKLAPLIWKRLYKSDRASYYNNNATPVRKAGTPPGLWSRTTILATIFVAILTSSFSGLLAGSHLSPTIVFSSPSSRSRRRRRCHPSSSGDDSHQRRWDSSQSSARSSLRTSTTTCLRVTSQISLSSAGAAIDPATS